MDKHIKIWIDVLDHIKQGLLGNLNDNEPIEALDNLVKDMERAEKEAEKGVMPCQRCGEKIIGTWHCKTCARILYPYDPEI